MPHSHGASASTLEGGRCLKLGADDRYSNNRQSHYFFGVA